MKRPFLPVFYAMLLLSFTPEKKPAGHYQFFDEGFGPHAIYSTLDLKSDKFVLKLWTSGFFRKNTRNQTGNIIAKGDTFILIPKKISFYRTVERKTRDSNKKYSCGCNTKDFTALMKDDDSYTDLCDTLKCYFKNDSLVFKDSGFQYYKEVKDKE